MPKSFQQKLKILYLMRVFSEKTDEAHPMSVKDLISYLESLGIHAERKTIYDDIETLRVFGMDIMNRRERPSGFYLASREFETAELKLLEDAVQFSRFLTVGKSRQLIQKLEHLTSIYQAKDLQRQAIVLDQVKNTNESIYYNVDEIHRAISQNRQISFQYTEWTVSKEKHLKKGGARYQISPWQMIWQDGNYYLIGVDEKSGIVKHYRVDKMLNITITAEKRDGGDQFSKFDIGNYSKRTFGMFAGDENTLEIEFDNNLIGVVMDRFGKDIILNSNTENTFVAKLNVNISSQFYGWLAGLGTGVKILSPQSEVEKYLKYIKDISSKYTHF